jgi:hypothetical protein
VLAKGGCAVSEVAKGFRQRRFFDLSDRDKRDMLKLMARVAIFWVLEADDRAKERHYRACDLRRGGRPGTAGEEMRCGT